MEKHTAVGLVLLALCVSTASAVRGSSYEAQLLEHLLTNHDSEPRPVLNSSHPVTVKIDAALAQIISVDSKNQQITVNLWYRSYWTDETMAWNESDFGGVNAIRVSSEKIWRPDIVVYNSLGAYSDAFADSEATIYSSGSLSWLYPVILTFTCAIDVTYFPYDEQTCEMQFGSWSFDGFKVDVHNRSAAPDSGNYLENEEWELGSYTVRREEFFYGCCPEPYPVVTMSIFIRRKTLYYNYNVVAPCILIVFVSLFGFWVPAECGEKLSLGVTMLLSLVVFMQIVSQTLPATSTSVPYIAQFFGGTIILVGVSVSLSAFGIYFHFHELNLKPPPTWLRSVLLVDGYKPWQLMKNRKKKKVEPTVIANEGLEVVSMDDKEKEAEMSGELNAKVSRFGHNGNNNSGMGLTVTTHMEKIDSNVEALRKTSDENEEQEELRDMWKTLAVQLDKVLMVGILVAFVVMTAAMFASLPPGILR
ncbi:neuronal acetylcholine receptor subunit alpha-7-like [Branchiostoma floridae]|uniref:Neuronal acetylcholine receptor subunit alpha-7-like n=2 Tax=Branchiostoma floridae TaxID=7739 RepID=A0A9J7MZV5_BRAFL|nr:neuronal acetylcholine receptor subunit alpha-7-like [Branchiostoma floridae]